MITELQLEDLASHKGAERYRAKQARLERDFGFGDTDAARVLIQENISALSEFIESYSKGEHFRENFKAIGFEKVAIATLTTAFTKVKVRTTVANVCLTIGRAIEAESWAIGFLTENEKKAKATIKKVQRKHGNLKYRKQSVRSMASRGGYKTEKWPNELCVKLGNWLLDALLVTGRGVFALADVPHIYRANGKDYTEMVKVLTLTDEAAERVESIAAALAANCPMLMPMVERPDQWTGLYDGGYRNKALKRMYPLVRVRGGNKRHKALLNHAIKNGSMKPVLDAVNTIQNVPFVINERMLSVLEWCAREKIEVSGLPPFKDYSEPGYPENWETLSDEEKRHWRKQGAQIKEKNIGLIGQRVVFNADMETARIFAREEAFYVPHYLDFRGRIYGMSHFNFQRGDYVRSLFRFRDGKPIGEDGMVWLAIHLASCGDFGKVSKKPFDARVEWVNENLAKILDVAQDPQGTVDWWKQADKPFLFVAACMEYAQALIEGPTFVSHLPVSFDGSCSGLQHLCGMTASDEGRFVNLTPSESPQDVYQAVADLVLDNVRKDAAAGHPQAQAWLRYGLGRKEVKRGVMTYCYSSRSFGMAEQINEDLMVPLGDEVLSGKRKDHPFGEGQGYKEAFYMGSLLCKTIEEFIHAPADAMGFLRKIALGLAHESKSAVWTTPCGLPVMSWYPEQEHTRITLFLHDRGFKVQHKVKIDTDPKDTVRKEKSANGIAPNFVHSMDACHLMMVVNAAASENITQVALVHDSFGCLASDATRWNEIIREQFARLYTEFDVLGEVRAQALKDITAQNAHRIPDVPAKGGLDLNDIKRSLYAFA